MIYKFVVDYTPTDPAGVSSQRVCSPLYGDDPNVAIERVNDEWYYTRKLGGKFTFVREDYSWIMAREFDGTYTMTVECSTDGSSWQEYFVGTFSRASLTIDEDNQNAVLDGLSEGTYNVIKNAKDTEYDLRKVIPDTEAKEVQGEIWPALALVDYRQSSITKSDIYCNGASVGSGYDSKHPESGYSETSIVRSDNSWYALPQNVNQGILVEAKVEMDDQSSPLNGLYAGRINYDFVRDPNDSSEGMTVPIGDLYNKNNCKLRITARVDYVYLYPKIELYDSNNQLIVYKWHRGFQNNPHAYSPASLTYTDDLLPDSGATEFKSAIIYFHYIRATLLTQTGGNADNVLDTGGYYKRMAAFNNQDGGLTIAITTNTVEQPNGHRLIAGTDLYFAPPQGEGWIPLAEDNWNYASMWYKITPSVANGLQDRSLMGTWRWTRCWTLGTVLRYMLAKVSGGKIHFGEDEHYSQFLYAVVNPVAQGEQFEWLFCQKSDVMNPGGQNSTRCPARLNWFLEYMKNALNCYWWLEKRNDGDYDFRLEHVEYFRRGSSYTDPLDDPMREFIDITKIKPLRNFPRNGQAAKRLSDQTNKYTFDLQGMAERYTFSWQGEGGSDEFKGNPMLFKAGWIEAGSSEDKQVDNIFADLSWLTLNAGTDTASSKNYEGLMVFSGYHRVALNGWEENTILTQQYLELMTGRFIKVECDVWFTTYVAGATITVQIGTGATPMVVDTYTSTGKMQHIHVNVAATLPAVSTLCINFGDNYTVTVLHRVSTTTGGNVYTVPNTASELTPGVYLQNGPLAWPSLQASYLHYDVPAVKWSLNSDDPADEATEWRDGGTVKLIKKQEVPKLPVPDLATEQRLKEGIRTGLGTGILDAATVNLGSRNAEMTLVYDITPLVS